MEEKKVLIISFFFPPNNAIAAVRLGKFAKYLPEFGWSPLVLTVNKAEDLSQALPVELDESNIIRTPYFTFSELFMRKLQSKNDSQSIKESNQKPAKQANPNKLLFKIARLGNTFFNLPIITEFLDEPIGWYSHAIKAGLEIVNSNDVNILFSSYGPSVSHLIAARLHRQTGIPWVAEFRDQWSSNPYTRKVQPLYFLEKYWEKQTMKKCDLLISTSQTWATDLEKLHSKKTIVLPNGFDQEDYEYSVPLTPKFSITYTGMIYPGKRDPSPLFQALGELKRKEIICPEYIEVRFFGRNIQNIIKPIANKYGILDLVKTSDNIPFKESIKKQMESTILLLLSWNDPRDAGTLTGKIYEYLGANRPILAMAYPGGEIDKLLQKSGCGIVANDPDEIKRLILVWLDEFKSTGKISAHFHPDSNIINSYTRQEQARALADVLNKVST
jgi:glycosyltransferase involved in cell wall biosynthesis